MKMKSCLALLLTTLVAAHAEPLRFKLSPAGSSPAVGLSPANEVPAVTNSTGSGNVLLDGITFDTNTLSLNFAVGYGSALGFTDLSAPASGWHIHGPADATGTAPVLFDLGAQQLPAGDPARGGLLFGSVTYTADQALELLAGRNYLNIHTTNNPDGEIRAQLILVTNEAPALTCPLPVVTECTSPNGALVNLAATVQDADGDALTVVWTVNGVAQQTNSLTAGNTTTQQVPFIANFGTGTYQVGVTVSDGANPTESCSTTVTVQDATPPVIQKLTPSPSYLWPPNHKMVPVKITVAATDGCGPVKSKIVSVTSNEHVNGLGDGNTEPDWQITGDLTLQLRAERSGTGNGRTYTIAVEAKDESGNASTNQVTVLVPHNMSQLFKKK
jgi:hypothetical protein